MSKTSSLDEKTKIKINTREATDENTPDESKRHDGKINIPKVSVSQSNDISRLNCSFVSSNPVNIASKINSETKINKKKISFENSNILNFESEIEYNIKRDSRIDDKRESNLFSEKALFDEINNAERDLFGENEKYDKVLYYFSICCSNNDKKRGFLFIFLFVYFSFVYLFR